MPLVPARRPRGTAWMSCLRIRSATSCWCGRGSPARPARGPPPVLGRAARQWRLLVRPRLAAASGREHTAVEVRVPASVAHLGLVARLVAPFRGAVALAGEPP